MSRSDPPANSRYALVVDDDYALRGLFAALLARKGFDVDYASDGREAFDHINRNNYSVILLDLMMPETNGFELLHCLERESPSLLSRVIVMTGASQRVIESLNGSSIWALIRKPFDIDDLLRSAIECSDGQPRRGNA